MPSRTASNLATGSAAPRLLVPHSPLRISHFAFRIFHSRKAFSLIELLVVIAIIGILSSLAVVGFNSIGRGSGVRGAEDLAASLALSARVEAMSFGYGSLLVIDNGTNPEHKLQRMAVLRYTNSTNFDLVGKPTALPKGTFFLTNYSKGMNATNITNFPGEASTPAYFFKFDGSGHLVAASATCIVFSGNIMDAAGNLKNPPAMIQGRRGFILRNNGRPAFFQTPEQMPINP